MADSYTVLSQKQTVGILPDETFGQIVRVTFRTAAGAVLSVEVPAASYNVETVKAMIEERVQHAQDIAEL